MLSHTCFRVISISLRHDLPSKIISFSTTILSSCSSHLSSLSAILCKTLSFRTALSATCVWVELSRMEITIFKKSMKCLSCSSGPTFTNQFMKVRFRNAMRCRIGIGLSLAVGLMKGGWKMGVRHFGYGYGWCSNSAVKSDCALIIAATSCCCDVCSCSDWSSCDSTTIYDYPTSCSLHARR